MATTKSPAKKVARKRAPAVREPSPVNIDHLTVKQLEVLNARIGEAIKARRESEAAQVRASILSQVENAGLTLEDVFGGKRRGGKAPVKYRDPDNYENTWTGRGRKPTWMATKLASDANLKAEDFKIAA